jgi:hypothetical protein
MKNAIKLLLFALVVALTSCETVIQVDIDQAPPRLVIEAEINDGPGPYTVHLSKSVGIDESSIFPDISGAEVLITDDQGHADTLQETTPGYYATSTLVGTPGVTYSLKVTAEGATYTSTSTMPQPVALDSIYNLTASVFGGTRYPVLALLRDPANVANQYRFIVYEDGKRKRGSNVENDDFFDGESTQIFLPGVGASLDLGDTVTLEMQCIDAAIFEYFDSFKSTGNGPAGGSAPSNPYTNIEGGALGYFNACTKTYKETVIR